MSNLIALAIPVLVAVGGTSALLGSLWLVDNLPYWLESRRLRRATIANWKVNTVTCRSWLTGDHSDCPDPKSAAWRYSPDEPCCTATEWEATQASYGVDVWQRRRAAEYYHGVV